MARLRPLLCPRATSLFYTSLFYAPLCYAMPSLIAELEAMRVAATVIFASESSAFLEQVCGTKAGGLTAN